LVNGDVVRAEKLSKVYIIPGSGIQVWALRGIDLTIESGDYVAILGASGSGKSTLMNIVGCLDRPTAGRFFLQGRDISSLDDNALSEIRGRSLGFVFQSFNLIAQLTVVENLEVPLFYQGVSPRERRARAEALAASVQLSDRLHHRPTELSGGQQQRVAIARALVNDPVFLLADEPTGNLDTKTGEAILDIFDQLNAAGKTIIMVTHEPDVAARCRRAVTLRDGIIIDDVRMR
jgi:putative ABC transport system ATP-binding protein